MAETQEAWAVVEADNSILIKTVSPTEQAALVNWLFVYGRMPVTGDWSIDDLRTMFQASRCRCGGRVAKVYVSLEPADGP